METDNAVLLQFIIDHEATTTTTSAEEERSIHPWRPDDDDWLVYMVFIRRRPYLRRWPANEFNFHVASFADQVVEQSQSQATEERLTPRRAS